MEYIKFIFSSFWVFIGFTLIFGGIGNFILYALNYFLRYLNIRKHGFPKYETKDDELQ